MIRIPHLFVLIVLVTTGCVQDKEYNYDIDYLHGNVKAIKYSAFSAKMKFGEAVIDEKEWTVMYNFNELHQIEKIIDYDLDGNLSYVTKCKYDSYGNLSSLSEYNNKGEIESIIECKYNDRRRVTKCQAYSCYGDEKDEEGYFKISYFNNGITISDDDATITYNVDPKSDGKISRIRSGENEQTTVAIVRNKDGNIIKTTNSTKPMFEDSAHPIFYAHIVRTRNQKTDDYLYEYEFDERHNWIKKIIYKNDLDHPEYICTRDIEYYE